MNPQDPGSRPVAAADVTPAAVDDLGPDPRLGAHLVIVAGAALSAADRVRPPGRFAASAYPAMRLKVTSWTSDISWMRGYDNVLAPMERASSLFGTHLLAAGVPASDPRYRRALFYLLACETSCYRYWGQGIWTDYGAELARRACEAASSAT
jgi:hypothetical protein